MEFILTCSGFQVSRKLSLAVIPMALMMCLFHCGTLDAYTPGGRSPGGGFRPTPSPHGPTPSPYRPPTPSPDSRPEPRPVPRHPRIIAPQFQTPDEYPRQEVQEGPAERQVDREKKVQVKRQRKLAKPRAPYLRELAMDIDKRLVALVRQDPAAAFSKTYRDFVLAQKADALKQRIASTNLGHVCYLTGRVGKSAACYSTTLAISRKLGETVEEGRGLRNLAAAFTASGDFSLAEKHAMEALGIFRTMGSEKDVQMTLNNLGVMEKNLARYSRALDYYEEASRTVDKSDQIDVLVARNMGNFFRSWGEYEKAVQAYEKAAKSAIQLRDYPLAGEIAIEQGQTYSQADRVEQSIGATKKALEILSKAKAPTDWSKKIMGDLLLDAGRLSEAEPFIKQADYDSSLGRLWLLKARPHEALKRYRELLSAAEKEKNLDELFAAHTGLGKAFEQTKDYDQAEQHYSKAVDIVEEIRSALLVSERRNFFSVKVSGFYRSEPAKGLVQISLKQKKPDRSIYPSEMTRAREFADNISQKADRRHFGVARELIEQDTTLANKLASLKTALTAAPKSLDNRRWEEITNDIKHVETEQKAFVRSLCETHKDYCTVIHPSPVDLDKADLGPDEYVLMLDALSDGVATRLLKGRKVLKASLLEWSPKDMDNDIRNFRAPFDQVQFSRFNVALARSLHDRLTAQVLEYVPADAPLVIIPDGVLALVPFEALVTGGSPTWRTGKYGDYPAGINYLGDRNPIVYSQSLTAMTLVRELARREKTGEAVLVMADPVFSVADERVRNTRISTADAGENSSSQVKSVVEKTLTGPLSLRRLRETFELGNSLEKQYGASCEVLTGPQCTKSAFLNRISSNSNAYGSIVFGTHGFTANDFPGLMEPFLALTMVPEGIDGFLTMSDVAGLKMNVQVAALIACKTGVGARLAGEGVMSMGRAFQCAGARSVIMSLWSVAEKPAVMLVEEFLAERKKGLSQLQAWIRSRAVLRKKGFEHPFFWASFILVGEKD